MTNDIKIPVSWIKKKGIKLAIGDYSPEIGNINSSNVDYINSDLLNGCAMYISSFAYTENIGVKVIDDWVPIDTVSNLGETDIEEHKYSWVIKNGTHYVAKWKPNIEALYKIYLAEQEEEIYALNKKEKIKAPDKFDWSKAPEWATMYGEMKGRSIVKCYANDGFFTPYSDPWNTFEKHEFGVGGNWNKEDFTCLQKRPDNHEAVSFYNSLDINMRPKDDIANEKLRLGREVCERIFKDNKKPPIYTKEMHDDGELPPVGWVGEVCIDLSSMISTLRHWKVGDHIKCVVHVKNSSGGDTPVFQHLDLTTVSGLLLECFKPIETKTDEQIAYESFMSNNYALGDSQKSIFHAGVEFARKQHKDKE